MSNKYTIKQIKKIYNISVNKYDVSIVITEEMKLEELKNIIIRKIIPNLKKETDFDELWIGFYEDKNLIGYGTTLGHIIASPTGTFTAKNKLKNDLSNLKINWNALNKFERRWKNRLTKQESEIFKEIKREWKKYNSLDNIMTDEQSERTIEKIAQKYNISKKEVDNIIFKHGVQFY